LIKPSKAAIERVRSRLSVEMRRLRGSRARRKVVMPGQEVFWLAGGRPKKA